MVNPAACATGVVPSAPLITVQVRPDTFVTRMISLARAGSEMWNWVGCVAPEDATGNDPDDATVHDWLVPGAGASVPPALH